MPVSLQTYASGNGAISFVYLRTQPIGPTLATGRKVSLAAARDYLRRTNDAKHFRDDAWRIVVLSGDEPQLVAPVRRAGIDKLEINGHVYRYTIDPNNSWWQREKHVQQVALTLWCEEPDMGEFVVRNVSIIAQCAHFLNHESKLSETLAPLWPEPYVDAGINI